MEGDGGGDGMVGKNGFCGVEKAEDDEEGVVGVDEKGSFGCC